jgi:hypothetical protein
VAEPASDWDLQIAQMRANVPRLKEAMEAAAETYSLFARQYKLYFDALVFDGFTPQQAMEIVKAQGWVPK